MTSLPHELQEALDREVDGFGLKSLQKAAHELASRYREQDKRESIERNKEKFMLSSVHRAAYVTARMPATYGVVRRVLQEVKNRLPETNFASVLDLGAGPGTVLWAALDVFPTIEKITLVEQDKDLMALGQRLASHMIQPAPRKVEWVELDLLNSFHFDAHDWVTLSYVVGEIPRDKLDELIKTCWQIARQGVIVIEPGTPHGFEGILSVRNQLIASGASLVAPCPHAQQCPLAEKEDWCHFAQRIERSREHRMLKSAELGYEDEKYSYVIGSKAVGTPVEVRLLRHPQRHSGHVNVMLCTREGLKQETVSRKNGELYKKIRKLEWGDGF